MLPKAKRLNSKTILELKTKGKRVNTTLFSVLYKPEAQSKFSANISKKVYKNAVDRNTAKRKVLSLVRDISPTSTGLYSINIRSAINKLPTIEIKKDLEKLLCQK